MAHQLNGVPPVLHTYRLKVVSKNDTNEDGRWISVQCARYYGTKTFAHFSRYVDGSDFLVKVTEADTEDDLAVAFSPSR
jgi:hypothetical protein